MPQYVTDGCGNGVKGPAEGSVDGVCCYVYCGGACCGRPFMVAGEARLASPAARSDWANAVVGAFDDEHLDDSTRRALSEAWLRDALLEHASIASFARFTLELLAVGAPPDLIDDAQRAMADEVEHARLCFALASRYAGEPVGPGPLALDGLALDADLVEIAARTVREGCVEETIAALVARTQLAASEDPDARRALARIADDEERHAEMAWKFVSWAIGRGGVRVRRTVEQAFEMALEEASLAAPANALCTQPELPSDCARHGQLSDLARAEIRRQALEEIVSPCLRRLLAPGPAGASAEEELTPPRAP